MSNFIIGDSLGVGLSAYLPGFEAHAVVSTTAAFWLGQDLSFIGPGDLVLISLGTNPERDFAGNAGTLVASLQAQGARVVWLSPPPLPPPFETSAMRSGIAYTGAEVIEAPGGLPRASDGVHCTARGYQQWAQSILATLPQMAGPAELQTFVGGDTSQSAGDSIDLASSSMTTPIVIGVVVFLVALALVSRRG
jgi:hypothetical protein